MAYQVLSKAPKINEGQIESTLVDIKQDEPYTIISRRLDGDHTQSTDNKLIELVLEIIHDETTTKTELVENVNELRKQVGNQNEIIQQALESNQLLSSAFEELSIVVLDQVLPQLEEKDVIDAIPLEDIAQPIGDEEPEEPEEPIEDEEVVE